MTNQYPTESELTILREWDCARPVEEFVDFLRSCWWYPERQMRLRDGVNTLLRERVKRLFLDTGGWSGNEEIIGALQENVILWAFYWVQSRRGGHYIFEFPMKKRK